MKLHLVDINGDLVSEWNETFQMFDEVEIYCCDILSIAENTIVSPANSYGFMDGGIDRIYTEHFGMRPQTEIQTLIASKEEGHLPVGEAVFVSTGDSKIPYMIAAPTMLTPGAVPASNCFFAMAAVLNAADRNVDLVTDVYCPGLGTLTGRLEPKIAATEMAKAYAKWKNRKYA